MNVGGFEFIAPTFFASALLLLLAGVSKLVSPANTSTALSAAALPSDTRLVRAFATCEILLGAAALIAPSRLVAVVLALMYMGFVGFVIRLMRRDDTGAGCGCVGTKKEAPPSWIHVGLNSVAAASGLGAAAVSPVGVVDVVAEVPIGGVGLVVGTLTIVYLAYVTALVWPSLTTSGQSDTRRRSAVAPPRFYVTATTE